MIYTLLFLLLTYLILTNPAISLTYAFHGMTIWYQKMVPSLLPFMILSSTVILMNLSQQFGALVHPITGRLFRCRKNVSYAVIMGFLCGFPMGAKVTVQLLKENKISLPESRFLLSFCNNFGPVYLYSFLIPALNIKTPVFLLLGMYGLPLIYAVLLRYTWFYKSMNEVDTNASNKMIHPSCNLLEALDTSIRGSISSISMLCGYMILFNLLNIVPHVLLPDLLQYTAPFLEITGGILLSDRVPIIYILILLPFGGLSCIAQTYSIIKDSPLSIKEYLIHKLILTGISVIYYWFMLRINPLVF